MLSYAPRVPLSLALSLFLLLSLILELWCCCSFVVAEVMQVKIKELAEKAQDSAARNWRRLDSEYELGLKASKMVKQLEEGARDVSACSPYDPLHATELCHPPQPSKCTDCVAMGSPCTPSQMLPLWTPPSPTQTPAVASET